MHAQKLLYLTIEINLLLWLAVTGALYRDANAAVTVAWVGTAFAAVAQHWAYYRLKRSAAAPVG